MKSPFFLSSYTSRSVLSLLRGTVMVLTLLVAWGSLVACSSSDDLLEDDRQQYTVVLDKPLRVLVLGNSFSVDGLTYLDELTKAADIDVRQYGIFNGMINGGGLAEWMEAYRKGTPYSFKRISGQLGMTDYGTVRDVLSQDWDIIVLMQSSDKSYLWESFEPFLRDMIALVRNHCTNPAVQLAYAIPWGHTEASSPKELAGNITCARRLSEAYGIDVVIPVGVAIQNARLTRLNNDTYLTRDDWHLCFGVGRYIAACTWYESLLTPRTRLPIVGNTALHPLSRDERATKGAVAVDESNRLLCQECALRAVATPFEVSQITE